MRYPCSHRILTFCLTGLIAATALLAQKSFAAGVTYTVAGTNPFPVLSTTGRLYTADFNNDGKLDIFYQNGSTSGSGIAVQLGNGDGTFQTAITKPTGATSPFTSGPFNGINFTLVTAQEIFFADLNADGKIDLIDNPGASTVPLVYLNSGTGFTATTSPLPAQGSNGRIAFGDYNNDGYLDILNQSSATAGTGFTLYLNTPATPGTFTTITQPTNGSFSSGPLSGIAFSSITVNSTIFVVDLNGDGFSDLILDPGSAVPTVYQNNGLAGASAAFTPVASPFGSQPASRFVFGDFNGDGFVDCLDTTSATNGSGISLFLNNATGSIAFTAIAMPTSANFTSGPFSGITFSAMVTNNFIVGDFNSSSLISLVDTPVSASRYITPQFTAPLITSSTPAKDATGVGVSAPIVLNFNKNVTAGTGSIRIRKTSDGSVVQTIAATSAAVAGSGTSTITITPPTALAGATGYYLTFDLTAFLDANGVGLGLSSGITRVPITKSNFLAFTTGSASSAPTVTTPTSASITGIAATLGGNVTSDGGATVTEIGVVYAPTATNPSPNIGGSGVIKVTGTGTTGAFTVSASSLTPGTGYTYAAYATNSVGTSYTSFGTFTTLSNNASLSALALSQGTLTPVFASGTTGYTASVANAVTSLTVTPTTVDSNATVKVNGSTVTSGTASSAISLNVGSNVITTVVTAQDGTTALTYTTTITRAAALPTVTTPTSASITGTAATLGGNVTSDGGATVTEIGVVYAPTATNPSPNIGGSGVIKVIGTGTSGVFTVSSASLTAGTGYSFAAYATNSAGTGYSSFGTFTTLKNNADLSALVLSAGTLSPVFASSTTGYTTTVLKASSSITATPTAADANATLQVRVNSGSYSGVTSGAASGSLALNLGSNIIDVLVTAQDGTTIKTYTTTVTRLTSLQSWRNQYFGTMANSGDAADTANPAHDGVSNLIKFVTGLDPTKNVRPADRIAMNVSTLEFTYPRLIDAMDEVTIIVEWSDSLQSNDWHTTGLTETILSSTATMQQVKVSVDATGLLRRFMRLRVTDP